MRTCLIKYSEAKRYIQTGDVLLFTGTSLVSYLLQIVGEGYFSHAAMTIVNKEIENGVQSITVDAIEFREWIGSRIINLENYVKQNSGQIHVFRPVQEYHECVYDCKKREISSRVVKYNPELLIKEFKALTGLPYGWYRIWYLAKYHMTLLRLFFGIDNKSKDDTLEKEDYYPVCSTIVARLFQKYYTDLVKYRSNYRTEPSDISRSPILSYLFTLTH